MSRLFLAAFFTVLFLLVSEGVMSLGFGMSWKDLVAKHDALQSLRENLRIQGDEERFEAAASSEGPLIDNDDPWVSYTFKPDTEMEHMRVNVRTDELGMRARLGPEPAPDAVRIVVLGDSVAYGTGLETKDVLATRLEEALGLVRGDPTSVACWSVAVPSWNFRNAFQFLRDELEHYDPDIVLYMHVHNDLEDAYGVYSTGHRRLAPDPASSEPLMFVQQPLTYLAVTSERLDLQPDAEFLGPNVLFYGLSPLSSGRIDAMADGIVEMKELMERRGGHFALLPYSQHPVHRIVRARLLERGEDVPVIPLLDDIRPGETLGWNPHPSAATVAAYAHWTAQSLLDLGWVAPLEGNQLPPLDPSYADRRTRELEGDELVATVRAMQAEERAALQPVLRHETLQGMYQVYGGIRPNGCIGPRFCGVLPAGNRLTVELAPVEARPSLYPLEIEVRIDGDPVGELVLPSADAGTVHQSFDVPSTAASDPLEVMLAAQHWSTVNILGKTTTVSARFVEMEVE